MPPRSRSGRLRSAQGHYVLARVAELGIEVIAEPGDNLVSLLRRETIAALRRMNLSTDLKPLAKVQTTLGFAVEQAPLTVRIPSLKDRALRAESDEPDGKKSLLQQIGTLLGKDRDKTYEADAAVNELSQALTANPPQSVLLVGLSGVGKTAAVLELARRWRNCRGRVLILPDKRFAPRRRANRFRYVAAALPGVHQGRQEAKSDYSRRPAGGVARSREERAQQFRHRHVLATRD